LGAKVVIQFYDKQFANHKELEREKLESFLMLPIILFSEKPATLVFYFREGFSSSLFCC